MPDYDLVLVDAHCAACARPVSAAIDELRRDGVFVCHCGALTAAPPFRIEARPLFRSWAAHSG